MWSEALGQPVPLHLSPHARLKSPGARSPSAAPGWPASQVRVQVPATRLEQLPAIHSDPT